MKKIVIIILVAIAVLTLIIFFLVKRNENPVTDSNTQTQENTVQTQQPTETNMPEINIDKNKKYEAQVETSAGNMTIELYASKTPITVNNFVKLAESGFYNNTIFHRVMEGFMIQGGDPKGDGTGGPGYVFDDEPFTGEYTKGTIAMANRGPNTNGSQFFIMHDDYPLPKSYVIFGKVTKGIETVDKIAEAPVVVSAMGEASKPVNPVKVLKVTISAN